MNSPRLADSFLPVFDIARRGFVDPLHTCESLAAVLIAELDHAAARARAQPFADTSVLEALFAVVAWVDETAMSADWRGASQWRLAPLQRHYFSTSRAGAEFFQRLEALPETAGGVREVFGLVLLNGFQGVYATRPAIELAHYRRQCLEQVLSEYQVTLLNAPSSLFAQPQLPQAQRSLWARRRLPGVVMALLIGIPLLILGGLYVSFDLALAQQSQLILEAR